MKFWISIALGYFACYNVCVALTLPKVIVPSYKFYGESAVLECPFDLQHGKYLKERLYAVKWYFNGDEFYRYIPKYSPPILTHRIPGVRVQIGGSDSKKVTLQNLDLHSTGIYRCEVSCEAPNFSSVQGDGLMTVIHLPEKGPQINGNVKEDYTPGDILDINCTTSESFPPARLTWYLNDLPVPKQYVIDSSPTFRIGSSIVRPISSVSNLRLPLQDDHFTEEGETKILCKSNISTTFWPDQDDDDRTLGSVRRTDSKGTLFNASPVTIFHQDALIYLRGSSPAMRRGIIWKLATFLTATKLVISPINQSI